MIDLDNCPDVRPREIGEVLRGNFENTIVKCIKTDLKILGGDKHLFMIQKVSTDYAIH